MSVDHLLARINKIAGPRYNLRYCYTGGHLMRQIVRQGRKNTHLLPAFVPVGDDRQLANYLTLLLEFVRTFR